MDIVLFIVALLPILVLIYYINSKDSLSPEPVGQLVRAFSSAPSSLPRKGMYTKYTPFRVNLDLAPNLTPSDNKLVR